MKREAQLLLDKAIDSLVSCIEHFNRPSDRGRITNVLIMLDHAFEMLMKAAILHHGGTIREPRKRETIGFDKCIRKGLSEDKVKFLSDEQALTLQAINGLRDAAHHHLIDISEQQLYLHAQAGITLFRDLLSQVFSEPLSKYLPERVLPVSTLAPTSIETLFDVEAGEIAKLLKPGLRRKTEVFARLRPLAILDATIRGEKLQPSNSELKKIAEDIVEGKKWSELFPGVASIRLTTEGSGPSISLRFSKKEGIPTQIVPEGTPGASVVGLKRVDELSFYNLGRDQLAEKIGLSGPKTTALVRHMKIMADADCYKEFTIGRTLHRRYSQKAIELLLKAIDTVNIDDVWKQSGIQKNTRSKS